MSRLESAIRRLEAQLACLNRTAGLIADIPGPILKLGLGNARTYDHLRTLMPTRRIIVFEREPMAHPDSMPPPEDLIEGDFRKTIPGALMFTRSPAALIHADFGSGDKAATAALASWLAEAIKPLCKKHTLIVSDQPLPILGSTLLPLPQNVSEGRYQMQQMI